MASSVKLISVRQIPEEVAAQNEFIWLYQMNDKWTPFSDSVSSAIERAFRSGSEEIFTDELYRIDLKCFVQERVDDRNRKEPIRRQRHRLLKSSVSSDTVNEDESRRRERFSFPLGLVSCCSAGADTNYYGSPFIAKWFLTFTNGKRSVTFDSIFPVLVQGLRDEGQTEAGHMMCDILYSLNKIRADVLQKSEKTRMKELEDYCAQLYTKPCFIYRTVNIALRDDDHTKLHTLGPYCFLLFNYIGRHLDNDFSIYHRLRQTFRPIVSPLITVFRGDYISPEMIEEYRHVVGDNPKYFKWLSFVSTSRDRDIAEDFAQNVLYIIKLQNYSLKDQFVDMSTISSCKDEREILLQPGVRFQVAKLEFDGVKSLHIVHIDIVPSYVSSLR